MQYIIKHGQRPGKQLTKAQRSHSKFAEEPVVMGKVFRRGQPPLKLTAEQFERNKTAILTLEKSGAIIIQRPTPVVTAPVPALPPVPPTVPAVVIIPQESAPAEVVEPPRGTPEPVAAVVDEVSPTPSTPAEPEHKKYKKNRKE